MTESTEGGEKPFTEEKNDEETEPPIPSDDEDDFEGYFLEPVRNSVDIAEKIAEANRKLQEETEYEGEECRSRRVQFSEELVNFEPNFNSDDECTQSAQNSVISEEDLDLKTQSEETKINLSDDLEKKEKTRDDDIPEDIPEEVVDPEIIHAVDGTNEKSSKFILILLPKEQNSSCESIIGEEIPVEKNEVEEKEVTTEAVKPPKTKIARPKSAKKSCDVAKISPNLSCTSIMERKSWQTSPLIKPKGKVEGVEKKNAIPGEIKVQIKRRTVKTVNVDDLNLENVAGVGTLKRCGGNRPRSCYNTERGDSGCENRPKTAPMKRTCCVIRTELPQYNGLRSEYGLSAEQLQERKQKSLENRLKRKQEQMKKRQDEAKRRNENEETFQKWLFNKTKKTFKKKSLKLRDTLTRSDVYIATHASYASNRSVPYSMDFSFNKKNINRKRETRGKKNKTIVIEKLFESMTPHFKRSFNIYLGVKS